MAYVMLVTWFYINQPPIATQTEFLSESACLTARQAIIASAAQLRAEADRQIAADNARHILSNPAVPTVSAVCAARK